MNELLKIELNQEQEPVISGRQLHEVLEIKTKYKDWFPRMVEYGFVEGADYTPLIFEHPQNKQAITDHALKLDMAKEIAMIQRSDIGRAVRQYFINVENEYNSPEKIMARALNIANKELEKLSADNSQLQTKVAIQEQQIAELNPKGTYYDLVLQCKDLLSVTQIVKDYGRSAKWLNSILSEQKVQFKRDKMWFLYNDYAKMGYTQSKTQPYTDNKGNIHTSMHTYWTQKGRLFIYDMLKNLGILPIIERERDSVC